MQQKKINLLHLVLSLETGGMERFVYEHCLAIDKDKYNVSVCCMDRLGGFSQQLIDSGISVELLQKKQDGFDYFYPLKLRKYLRKNKIDILHTHSGSFFHGSVAGFIAKTSGIVYTEHGRHFVEPRIIYVLDKISSLCANSIITVSPDLRDHLVNNIKLPSEKIKTIINGVNTDIFAPRIKKNELLSEFGIDRDTIVIGTVGRLAVVKDQATLIESFRLIKNELPEAKLILVGEGPCENDLRKLTADLRLTDSVVFAGSRSDVADIYNVFDVFVLTSLKEGTSFSLLEAMASSVPSVVTNVGGNVNIIENRINGLLVNPKKYSEISKTIINILKDNPLKIKIGQNCRDFVVNNFSLRTNISKYTALYEELLKL